MIVRGYGRVETDSSSTPIFIPRVRSFLVTQGVVLFRVCFVSHLWFWWWFVAPPALRRHLWPAKKGWQTVPTRLDLLCDCDVIPACGNDRNRLASSGIEWYVWGYDTSPPSPTPILVPEGKGTTFDLEYRNISVSIVFSCMTSFAPTKIDPWSIHCTYNMIPRFDKDETEKMLW